VLELVGYARVSTRDQTPALQLDALGAAGCRRVFEEIASGAQRDRPQLRAALGYLREGDTLVVWKLDRLARSTQQLIGTVEELARRGIGFRCLTQDIDTTSAGGCLIFTIFSAIAEFEREIIRERTRAGLDAARALLRDPELTMEEVAGRLGVAPSTLYASLPGGRSALVGVAQPVRPFDRL
jgi:DNA invertase Pin-like site-specific DNA recombinase